MRPLLPNGRRVFHFEKKGEKYKKRKESLEKKYIKMLDFFKIL